MLLIIVLLIAITICLLLIFKYFINMKEEIKEIKKNYVVVANLLNDLSIILKVKKQKDGIKEQEESKPEKLNYKTVKR